MGDMHSIGERIRATREARGMTQDQLAEILGLDESAVSRIESGKRGLAATELALICEQFEIRSDELLFGEQDEAHAGALLRADDGADAERVVARANDVLANHRYVKALIES